MLDSITDRQLDWFGRATLFIIFFWFGILKVAMLSPADQLVESLQSVAIPFMDFAQFFPLLGLAEMVIGALFLFPRASRIVIVLLLAHIAATFLPLLMLPAVSWQSFLVPTLIGQYIIKNLALVALALLVTEHGHRRWLK